MKRSGFKYYLNYALKLIFFTVVVYALFVSHIYSSHAGEHSHQQNYTRKEDPDHAAPHDDKSNESQTKVSTDTFPRVVIIIDDVGVDMVNFTELMNIPYPLNISVLPNQRFSKICAEIAEQKGHDVMLHQPMQPQNGRDNYMGPDGIRIDMKPARIKQILESNLKSLTHIKAVNNHMGSLATKHPEVMKPVMEILKKHRLIFVDSVTTGSSIAYNIAKENGVTALKRDLFIDAEPGYKYAKRQLLRIPKVLKKKKIGVVIAHSRLTTIKALNDILPKLEKRGIKFIHISGIKK